MKDLYSFLEQTSNQSDFKANLSNRGGFITFSNSGRRGSVKYFQIGLDSLLTTLKDILAHLDVFGSLTDYVETPWRDNGSAYFTDPVANANSTVQTKPLFSTLSKIIIWANQPDLDNVDPDQKIVLTNETLSTAIDKLEAVAETFRPKTDLKPVTPSNTILFQFDDATKFVWECIKLFNKNKELKQLLSSDYRANGGSTGNYLRINGCFVAQLGQNDIEGFESIYTDEEGYINNGFDAREVDKFAVAINDVFAGRYKVVIEGNIFKLFKIVALDEPRQQIFFGAPGTGKSYRVEQITEQFGDDVIRTTFHPDSDYSTFVGCYKPTMQELQGELTDQPILDYDSLVDKFKEYLNVPNANITKACTLFGYHYHNSIVRMQEQGRRITDLVNDAYKSNTSYDSVVRGGMACYEEERYIPTSKTEIAYSFVPQAFTQAYTRAWLNPSRPIFLVIEELNRGNCAQIFGDIFQLLDRNDKNESAYSIIPDNDLQKHLADQFKDADNIPADIQSGLKMRLPSNLYIWATMNTSDQSLFPIDSAFKRRWIWKYIPIANAELDYKIQVGDKQYDWWSFVEKVNNEIEGATKSEDKKLGYFFAKAENGIIPAETFVSKVVFYLWNDVFKDSYDKTIFKDGLTFHRFFEPNGDPRLEIIDTFLHDLDLKAIGEE